MAVIARCINYSINRGHVALQATITHGFRCTPSSHFIEAINPLVIYLDPFRKKKPTVRGLDVHPDTTMLLEGSTWILMLFKMHF